MGSAPHGRLGVNPSDLRNMAGLEDCTECAGLLFLCIEVQVRIGERLPDAQHHCREQRASLQQASKIERRARYPFRICEDSGAPVVLGHGVRLHRLARARAVFIDTIADVVLAHGAILQVSDSIKQPPVAGSEFAYGASLSAHGQIILPYARSLDELNAPKGKRRMRTLSPTSALFLPRRRDGSGTVIRRSPERGFQAPLLSLNLRYNITFLRKETASATGVEPVGDATFIHEQVGL